MQQEYFIRSASLSGIDTLVAELGGDINSLLNQCQLMAQDLRNPDNLIAFSSMINLLELASEQLSCNDFGLRLAAKQGIDMLGAVGLIIQSSRSVREALIYAQRYMAIHSHGEYWMLREFNLSVSIERYQVFQDINHARQYKELSFGVCLGLIKTLIGSQVKLERLEFAHAEISDAGIYRKYFECPVVFNQENDRLIINNSYLTQPLQVVSDLNRNQAEAYLELLVGQLGDDIERKVKTLILQTMGMHNANINEIAAMLNMNRRTLQRRLAIHGLTFKALLAEVRVSTACWHLTSSHIDITLLSEMLGYSGVSAFSKSFKQTVGHSPLQWRKLSRNSL
ncbi:AraC family transcriptional regulator [uncultured Shewanella sp.]|uniref:AraC family transcriptional regulator n=1 Tax=uncultured Shewanella sp. TaxID=173975 RepID=UPI0026142C5E|nr:AraC family transcriptional regulator ligand-binding domain-containing protein [uncultured Shewanella sp.]